MLCEVAAKHGLLVDMHCDETDDPMSRHVETLAFEAQRLGLQGRVTGSHLTSMHSMDNYYVSKLIPLLQDAELQVVANPLINITIQGRHDLYPKRRGMTRVKELLDNNINVVNYLLNNNFSSEDFFFSAIKVGKRWRFSHSSQYKIYENITKMTKNDCGL